MASGKFKSVNENPVVENSSNSLIYLAVLFFSCLILSRNVLDYTLTPRFVMLSLGLLLVVVLLLFGRTSINYQIGLPGLACIGYILINLLSFTWAGNIDLALFDGQKVFAAGLVFFLTTAFLRSESGFETKLLRVVVIITLIYGAGALFQYIKLKDYDYQTLYNVNSLSGHKNLLSCMLFLAIPFSLTGILSDKPSWKPIYIAGVILAVLMIMLLQTRSVWLALLTSVSFAVIFGLLKLRESFQVINRKILIISVSGVFLAGLLLFSFGDYFRQHQFLERFDISTYSNSNSGIGRFAVWKKTTALCKEYPLLGVGAGNWQIQFPKNSVIGIVEVEFENKTFQRPHNDFLWVLAETGVVGIIFYLTFFISIIFYGLKVFLKKDNIKDNFSTLILCAGLVGFLIISFFDFPRERIEILIVSNVLAALLHHRGSISVDAILNFNDKSVYWRLMNCFLLFILCSNLVTGFARIRGESNMHKVYKYRAQGNSERMIHYCEKATSLFYQTDPTTIPINWYKGQAYFSTGRYREALSEYEKAVSISPYNHYLLNDLASAFEMVGNHKKAEDLYLEALRINPYCDDPKLNLAAIYYNAKKYKEAWKLTNEVRVNSERKEQFLNVIRPFIKKF